VFNPTGVCVGVLLAGPAARSVSFWCGLAIILQAAYERNLPAIAVMYRLLAMYAVFMAIHMTHGRFNGYSDGHVACCKPQSSADGVIGREVA